MVDSIYRKIPVVRQRLRLQQRIQQLRHRTHAGMEPGGIIEITHPPVLQAGFFLLVFFLVFPVFPDVFCRLQDLLRQLRVLGDAQTLHQGYPVHVHGVDIAVPRKFRVQTAVIG